MIRLEVRLASRHSVLSRFEWSEPCGALLLYPTRINPLSFKARESRYGFGRQPYRGGKISFFAHVRFAASTIPLVVAAFFPVRIYRHFLRSSFKRPAWVGNLKRA